MAKERDEDRVGSEPEATAEGTERVAQPVEPGRTVEEGATDGSVERGDAFEVFREPDPEEGLEEPVAAQEVDAELELAVEVVDEDPSEPSERDPDSAPTPAFPSERVDAHARPLRVIAVGGARGGVGKTILAANLGLYLATIGRRVVLVDADPGGANLHTTLGTQAPPSLNRIRRGRAEARAGVPEEALMDTPFPSLRLLHAGLDEPAGAASRGDRLARLMARLRELDAEYVVIDFGVGLGRELLDAYLSADLSVFIAVPEPTSIENTYRFIRGAFSRFLLTRPLAEALRVELERRIRNLGGAPAPLDLLAELEGEGSELAGFVRDAMQAFHPKLIINQTRLRADLHLGFGMQSAARRRLGITLDYVGHIDHDDTVWTCARNRRPVLLEVPGAKSSKKIEKIARRLLVIEAGKAKASAAPSVPVQSHHDLLEVERGATDEEVRRAYKRCREVYSHDALCCYGLLESHEIEKLRARLDEAFDVLLDPARRRPYEMSVFPEALEEVAAAPDDAADEPPRPPPDINPDTQFTGSLLRQVRESHRVSLSEISKKTKIGVPYLKAIEDDDFSNLPAVVYAKGFLTEFARFLKLDPKQVSRTYVRRYQRFLDERERGLTG